MEDMELNTRPERMRPHVKARLVSAWNAGILGNVAVNSTSMLMIGVGSWAGGGYIRLQAAHESEVAQRWLRIKRI